MEVLHALPMQNNIPPTNDATKGKMRESKQAQWFLTNVRREWKGIIEANTSSSWNFCILKNPKTKNICEQNQMVVRDHSPFRYYLYRTNRQYLKKEAAGDSRASHITPLAWNAGGQRVRGWITPIQQTTA